MSDGLGSLRGMARGAPQVTRCEWCGEYTRKPCQCPAEVEIDRLRAALISAQGGFALAYDAATKHLNDEVLLHCGHHEAQAAKALDA